MKDYKTTVEIMIEAGLNEDLKKNEIFFDEFIVNEWYTETLRPYCVFLIHDYFDLRIRQAYSTILLIGTNGQLFRVFDYQTKSFMDKSSWFELKFKVTEVKNVVTISLK